MREQITRRARSGWRRIGPYSVAEPTPAVSSRSCSLMTLPLSRSANANASEVVGGVPPRAGATGTLYMAPMTTNQDVLLWILLGIGGGMTYGRWRAERIRARTAMSKTWKDRKTGRGAKTWRPW